MNILGKVIFLVIGLIFYFFTDSLCSLGYIGLILSFLLIILGIYLLLSGGDALVEGSVSLAKKFRISPIVIGLTIVSFGTSAPEFFVNILAALKGENNLLLSNIIGSNLANLLLILGTGAIVAKDGLKIRDKTLLYEIPFSLLSAVVLGILVNDVIFDGSKINLLSRGDGMVLLCFFIVFLYYVYTLIKTEKTVKLDVKNYSTVYSIALILIGVISLYFGGELVVNNAVWFAQKLGVSTFLIGTTVIAIGTSLPELVATVVSTKKGYVDVAVGNVIGSNIFNVLWIGGVSSVLHSIIFEEKYNIDLLFLILVTFLLIIVVYLSKQKILSFRIGAVFVILYFIYLILVIFRG